MATEAVLREREVRARVKMGRTTIWEMERRGEFPRRRQITGRTVGWLESEITEWIRSRPTPEQAADRPDPA